MTDTDSNRNLEKAISKWQEMLREDPNNDWARDELKKLFYKAERWNALKDFLKQEVATLDDDSPEEKIALWEEIIDISRSKINTDEMVLHSYFQAIFRLDPTHQEAKDVILENCRANKRWGELAQMLSQQVAKTSEPQKKIAILHELAAVWMDQLSNTSRATKAWEQIHRLDPEDAHARERLKDVYEKRKSWKDLFHLLEQEAGKVETNENVEQLIELARMAGERLGQKDRATALWNRVLELDTRSEDAIGALESDARRRKDWARVAELLEVRIGNAQNPAEQLVLLGKLASTFKTRLEDRTKEAEVWRRVLMIDPSNAKARRLLKEACLETDDWLAVSEIYEEQGDYHGLVEFLGTMAEKKGDRATKKQLFLKCIDIFENHLDRPDRAKGCYEQVLRLDPKNERALRAMAPEYRAQKNWKRFFDAIAILYPEDIGPVIADLDEEELNALGLVARGRANWSTFLEITKQCRTITTLGRGQWRALTFEIAAILGDRLSRHKEEIAVLEELLEQFPGDAETMGVLRDYLSEKEYRADAARVLLPQFLRSKNSDAIKEVLAILIEETEDRAERLQLRYQLAEIFEEFDGDLQASYHALLEGLADWQGNEPLIGKLETMAESLDMFEELAHKMAEAHSRLSRGEAKSFLGARLAEIFEKRLASPEKAEPYYAQLLREQPTNESAVAFLESFYTLQERFDDLMDTYDIILTSETSKDMKRTVLSRISVIADKISEDPTRAISAYRAILELEPENQDATAALERLYEKSKNWRELYDLLQKKTETLTEDAALEIQCRLAEIDAEHLHNKTAAFERYKNLLTRMPSNTRARQGMERLLENEQTRYAVARFLRELYTKIKATGPLAKMLAIIEEDPALSPAERAGFLVQLGVVRGRYLNDTEGTFDAFIKAFPLTPQDKKLRAQAERLAIQLGKVQQYANVLKKEAARAKGENPLELQLLRELARLCRDELKDAAQTEETYWRLLEKAPKDRKLKVELLEGLEQLLTEREEWAKAIDILQRRAALASDISQKAEILHRIVEIEETKLKRPQRAIEQLKAILDENAKDKRALEALARLLEQGENWIDLMGVLRELANIETSPQAKRALFVRFTNLASQIGKRR